jgi:hypothetical protein
MPEYNIALLVPSNVYDDHIVCVDVNGFVTDDQLFHLSVYISEHIDIRITYIQFVLILDVELRLVRVLLLNSEHEEPKLLLIFV